VLAAPSWVAVAQRKERRHALSGTSLAGLLIICGVIVIGLATWIGIVFWAGSHPRWKRAQKLDQKPGDVRGGVFKARGRAVMPRRDAPPDPDL
jgi:type VI protein secretion system component VasK